MCIEFKKKKILEVQKISYRYKIIYDETINYKHKPGVWVMYDENGVLLEVAETSNIYKELKYNLSLLMKDYSNALNRTKKYSARKLFDFSLKFDVLKCDKNRRAAKYRNIADSSNKIEVYLISNDQSKDSREEIEMKMAIDNCAVYWNAYGQQRKAAMRYYNFKENEKLIIK